MTGLGERAWLRLFKAGFFSVTVDPARSGDDRRRADQPTGPVEAWRGASLRSKGRGMSWTLYRECAVPFAKRGPPVMLMPECSAPRSPFAPFWPSSATNASRSLWSTRTCCATESSLTRPSGRGPEGSRTRCLRMPTASGWEGDRDPPVLRPPDCPGRPGKWGAIGSRAPRHSVKTCVPVGRAFRGRRPRLRGRLSGSHLREERHCHDEHAGHRWTGTALNSGHQSRCARRRSWRRPGERRRPRTRPWVCR